MERQVPGSRPLRCGIIGLGGIGWRYDRGVPRDGLSVTHASCLARHPATRLVAGYDPALAAREEFAQTTDRSVAIAEDLEGFFAQDLDLVSICSPTEHHVGHLADCLDHDIPLIWLEKPVAPDLGPYRALLERWRQMVPRPRVSVNYFRRSLPQYRYLIDRIAAAPGSVAALEVTYSRGLAVNGVHMLDLIGACCRVDRAPDLAWLTATDAENPSFGLRIGGLPILVSGLDVPYHCIEIRATFDDGRITIARSGQDTREEVRLENPEFPGFYLLSEPGPVAYPGRGQIDSRENIYPTLCNLLSSGAALHSSLETAYFAQDLLDKVLRAVRGRGAA